MNNEQAIGLTFFLIIWMLGQALYMRHLKETFWQDNQVYQQVGMMESTINGDKVYFPVFKKRN